MKKISNSKKDAVAIQKRIRECALDLFLNICYNILLSELQKTGNFYGSLS